MATHILRAFIGVVLFRPRVGIIAGILAPAVNAIISGLNIKTFVLRGKADYVLFPKLDTCVKWPWSGG